jgi:hypothetical protein
VTDGGYDLPTPGDRVRDRDGDDGDELLVVETHPDTTAEDHRIDAIDATVADVNVDHPGDAPVVEAVYVEDLERGDVTSREPRALRADVAADRLRSYTFPSTRLAPVNTDDGVDDTTPLREVWGASDPEDTRDGPHMPDDEAASPGGGRGV